MEDAIIAMHYVTVVLMSNLKHTGVGESGKRPKDFKDPWH